MASDLFIKNYTAEVRKVLIYTLILNAVVAIAKVLYGYLTNSIAMISDGFHSIFDGTSNVIGLVGIWMASHPPDEKHPYGHKKYETLFTIIIAAMLFVTCFQILKKVYVSFYEDHKAIVTQTSFFIMLITMGVNILSCSEKRKGKARQTLIATHTKSDILVSFTVIVSLVFTKMGYYHADSIVGLIIAFFIARIGYNILKNASDVLVDTVCMDNSAIEFVVNSIEGVKGCHDIRTRGSTNAAYVDLHVFVDGSMSTEKAHGIADIIEERIQKEFPSVVDIVVHVEPDTLEH
jgi:cation diffusion facilitator family transporter